MANFDLFGIAATSTYSGTPTINLESQGVTTQAAQPISWSCDPWAYVTDRPECPTSPLGTPITGDPYIFTPGPSSLISSCRSIYWASLSEFLTTAPIAPGPVTPMSVVSTWISEFTQPYWIDLHYKNILFMFSILTALFATSTRHTPDAIRLPRWTPQFFLMATTNSTVILGSTTVDGTPTWTDTTFLSTSIDGGETAWTYAAITPYTYVEPFTFYASEPCCLTCTLYGGNVQVFYWPTSTAKFSNSSVSTLVDSNGFTFVSPSIYVAFRTLYATDLCGDVGPRNQPTTLAFNPNELSTSLEYRWNRTKYSFETPVFYEVTPVFTPATWGIDSNCVDSTISFWQQINGIGFSGTIFNGASVTGGLTREYSDPAEISSVWSSIDMESFRYYTVTYNSCSPLLEVPTAVYSINPLWKACAPGIYALFDPPYVLTPGSGLSAFSTTTAAIQDAPAMTTTQASAGSTPQPVTASMTSTPTTPPTPSDPPSSLSSTNNPPAQSPTSFVNLPAQSTSENDPAVSSPSTDDPPAQPATTADIDPPAHSPPTNDPPTQQATIVNTNPVAASPSSNMPNTSSSSVVSTPAAITIGSSTIVADPSSAFIIASKTLTPGGQIVVSSTTYSLASNGASLVVGDTSTHIIIATSDSPPPPPSPEYQVGSQTLVVGGAAVTISGTVYSIPSGGSSVVVGGTTQSIGALLSASPEYVMGSQTLVDGGPAVTISGSVVSLQSGGFSVEVGSKTEALSVLLGGSTTTVGIGGIIATVGGFGNPSSVSLSTSTSTASYLQVGGSSYPFSCGQDRLDRALRPEN